MIITAHVWLSYLRSEIVVDCPWIFRGLSMDLSHANVHLSGSNSRRFLLDLGSR